MTPGEKYRKSEKGKATMRAAALRAYQRDPVKSAFNRSISQAKFSGYAPPVISLDEYRAMVESQKNCAICGIDSKRLCLDHCHKTGTVRGMLCRSCNTVLGSMKDDPLLLIKAAYYLDVFCKQVA